MTVTQFMALVVAADLLLWTGVFFWERREWDAAMGILAANVCVIGLNVAVICAITFLRAL